jgi:hypothetical protein
MGVQGHLASDGKAAVLKQEAERQAAEDEKGGDGDGKPDGRRATRRLAPAGATWLS